MQALTDKTVDGILIDAYKAGENKSVLATDAIRPVKLVEYPRYYGFVFSGPLATSSSVFVDFLTAKSEDVVKILEKTAVQMKVCSFTFIMQVLLLYTFFEKGFNVS